MKLLQTVVSAEGFRDPASNHERLALLAELARRCAREGGRLLLIPAGYLTAPSEEGVTGLIGEVRQVAEAAGVAILGGVDVRGTRSKGAVSIEDAVREGRLGYFGFATGPGVQPAEGRSWRQTSIDNANAELVPDDGVPGAERVITVSGTRVAVLICGELFSRRARSGVGGAGANLVVDAGHAGMGQGLIPAMRSLAAAAGCPVAHSQHLSGWYGRSLHFVDGQGTQQSTEIDEARVMQRGALWAAWSARGV